MKIILKIDGMTCSACSSGLEKYLKKQKGIIDVAVNLVLGVATIEYNDLKQAALDKYVSEAGFTSRGEFKGIEAKESNNKEKIFLIIMGFIVVLLMYVMMSHMFNLPTIPYLDNILNIAIFEFFITIFFLIYGYDILRSGFKNLIHRMPNMDSLVFFSVITSFLYSVYGLINVVNSIPSNLYFESTCMVIYFIKLGRYIENKSKDKTTDAIRKLVQITPMNALLKKDGEIKKVTLDEINIGDTIICRPGDKIAVDGEVIIGKTYVDESFITGESVPVLKEIGSKVIAGSINYNGSIEYTAEKIGKDTTISEIVKLVVNATSYKNKIQRIADKISGYFVPIIILIALLTFIMQLILGLSFNDSLIHFVTILVVACPCSLGLAVPIVVAVSNGICAKKGLFIRNSEVLENARLIDTVVFDKTGTLTYGKLNIHKIFNYSKISDDNLLNIVSNIEAKSSHPIGSAFKISKNLEVENYKNYDGIGIYGEIDNKKYYLGNDKFLKKLKIKEIHSNDYDNLVNSGCSIIYIIENDSVIGLIGVKDVVRDDIKDLIKTFNKNSIEVIMLTGDNKKTSNIIAKELGINNVISDVYPKDKAIAIKKLIDDGRKVIMVGDGINDAPALINADIGISVNDGTDVAMDSASVILMNNNMNNIMDLINISKKSFKIIKQNLFWAFFYNICMIPIAMGLFEGFNIKMNPMFGSIAMTISSITVVLNSLRLNKGGKDEKNN